MDSPEPSSAPFSVLVVEDDYFISLEMRSVLTDAGYHVIGPVATIETALAALASQRPDACVLDVNLRGKHSVPVAVALNDQHVPFVLSSAYEQDTLGQYEAFNGVLNIGKPAHAKDLLSALSRLLQK